MVPFVVLLAGSIALLLAYSYFDPIDHLFGGAALIILISAALIWIFAGFGYMLLAIVFEVAVFWMLGLRTVWTKGVTRKAEQLVNMLVAASADLSRPEYKRLISHRKTGDLLRAVNLCDTHINTPTKISGTSPFKPEALAAVREFLVHELHRRGATDQLALIR